MRFYVFCRLAGKLDENILLNDRKAKNQQEGCKVKRRETKRMKNLSKNKQKEKKIKIQKGKSEQNLQTLH
jgi:hypothetical protein